MSVAKKKEQIYDLEELMEYLWLKKLVGLVNFESYCNWFIGSPIKQLKILWRVEPRYNMQNFKTMLKSL